MMKSVRRLAKQIIPFGLMRRWLIYRYGVEVDQPLFHYPGVFKGLKRIVKFALPYGVVRLGCCQPAPAVASPCVLPSNIAEVNRVSHARRERESTYRPSHKMSILVPVYNTEPRLLKELIASVLHQTCGAWELCLGDASDPAHARTSRLAVRAAAREGRIKYVKLACNGGISLNTNAILPAATGDVIALLDHDDLLHPSAIYRTLREFEDDRVDFVYTDELTFEDSDMRKITASNLKPDYSSDYLRGTNYICHFSAFRRTLIDRAGGFLNPEYDGSQDHDLFLRMTAVARKIRHVPEVLYFWRACAGSTARDGHAKSYASATGCRAVAADLRRRGWTGTVEAPYASTPGAYRIHYKTDPSERVSIVIPTRDHVADLRKCLTSIFSKSTYRNYEIVIVDNGSTDPAAEVYYRELERDGRVKVLHYDVPFNYSEINNFAVRQGATGKYLLFLNNDTEVIEPGWIEEMQMFAQRPDVGCVGAKLFYPDGTLQHGGVILGVWGVAGHAFLTAKEDDPGPAGRLIVPVNYSAVTAACLMVRRDVFDAVGGFSPEFAVAFNDVDFCLRVREAGYLNVWTPFATLYHYESKSRGQEDTPEKQARFEREVRSFQSRWKMQLDAGDPFYNENYELNALPFTCLRQMKGPLGV